MSYIYLVIFIKNVQRNNIPELTILGLQLEFINKLSEH